MSDQLFRVQGIQPTHEDNQYMFDKTMR